MSVLEGFACDFVCHIIGGASGMGGFDIRYQAIFHHVTGAGAWKGMGIRGLSWECGGNMMGAALGKRWEGELGPEVVAR